MGGFRESAGRTTTRPPGRQGLDVCQPALGCGDFPASRRTRGGRGRVECGSRVCGSGGSAGRRLCVRVRVCVRACVGACVCAGVCKAGVRGRGGLADRLAPRPPGPFKEMGLGSTGRPAPAWGTGLRAVRVPTQAGGHGGQRGPSDPWLGGPGPWVLPFPTAPAGLPLCPRVVFTAAPPAPSPHAPARGLLTGRPGVRRTWAVLPQALWAHFSTEKG